MMEILVSNLLTQSLISIPPETSENQRFSDIFRATGMKHWVKTGSSLPSQHLIVQSQQ